MIQAVQAITTMIQAPRFPRVLDRCLLPGKLDTQPDMYIAFVKGYPEISTRKGFGIAVLEAHGPGGDERPLNVSCITCTDE
jgi:hypothetical protein